MTEIERLTDSVATLAEKVSALATAVSVQSERWESQDRVNQIVLEHGRALYGQNGNEGVVGSLQTHRQENNGEFKAQEQRLKVLEDAEAAHADRLKYARRLLVTQLAVVLGGLLLAGVVCYLGWN